MPSDTLTEVAASVPRDAAPLHYARGAERTR